MDFTILDSNHIELKSEGYYGRFRRRDSLSPDEFHKGLAEFKLNAIQKQELEGKWALLNWEMLSDTSYPKSYLDIVGDDEFLGKPNIFRVDY